MSRVRVPLKVYLEKKILTQFSFLYTCLLHIINFVPMLSKTQVSLSMKCVFSDTAKML